MRFRDRFVFPPLPIVIFYFILSCNPMNSEAIIVRNIMDMRSFYFIVISEFTVNQKSEKINFFFSRDRLLVAHGKLDENVHFQHTENLLVSLSRHCKPIHLQVHFHICSWQHWYSLPFTYSAESFFFCSNSKINNLMLFFLQVYPTERHSLRHMDVSEHFETTLICFLADHL